MIRLEVCIDTLQSALAAEAGGAHRIELCENLAVGGLTPTADFALQVTKAISIPSLMMVRPRPGNFVYNTSEFEQMKKSIILAHKLQMQGVVLGILLPDGHIDIDRTKELVSLARPMEVTFHRAFDDCVEPLLALEQLIELGIDRVLTSGQKPKAEDAMPELKELVDKSNDRIAILPGSGINSSNIASIHHAVGAAEYHGSFKSVGESETCEGEVRKVIHTLQSIN